MCLCGEFPNAVQQTVGTVWIRDKVAEKYQHGTWFLVCTCVSLGYFTVAR